MSVLNVNYVHFMYFFLIHSSLHDPGDVIVSHISRFLTPRILEVKTLLKIIMIFSVRAKIQIQP